MKPTMAGTEVARHHAHTRPGYELMSYREVALPLFKVECKVLITERKEIPPIQEYVLRTVAAGLTDARGVSGILGIDEAVTQAAIVDLVRDDNVALVASPEHEDGYALSLTPKGRKTVEATELVDPVETLIHVFVDGLTGEVISLAGRDLGEFPASRTSDKGLIEIPSHPDRAMRLSSISIEDIKPAYTEGIGGHQRHGDLIGLVAIGKARKFAREGVALAFRSQADSELIVSLVVDGNPSEKHDTAYSRVRARSAWSVEPEQWESAHDVISGTVPGVLIEQAAPQEQVSQLESDHSQAVKEASELAATVSQTSDGTNLQAVRERLADAEARERALRQTLDEISVRQVPVYEHRDYFDSALRRAQRRIMIISPWIRGEVVDNELLSRFRKSLDRGVEIYVGYGIEKDGGYRRGKKGEADRDTERALRRLEEDYSGFHMKRLGDTHAKVLICDSRFAIVTSFNWLSFKGDIHLKFRDERGMYVGLTEKVDDLFDSYAPRFGQSQVSGMSRGAQPR